MRKRTRLPKIVRLFLFFIIFLCFLFFCHKLYSFFELQQQIHEAELIRQQLLEDKQNLEERKKELNDPAVLERKARDDLGMVKPGEVPYVK